MAGSSFFDRNGERLALVKWAELLVRDDYRFIERTWIVPEVLEVVTRWEGYDSDPTRVEDGPARTFCVAEVEWAAGDYKDGCVLAMPSTEAEALAVHHAVVLALRRREERSQQR